MLWPWNRSTQKTFPWSWTSFSTFYIIYLLYYNIYIYMKWFLLSSGILKKKMTKIWRVFYSREMPIIKYAIWSESIILLTPRHEYKITARSKTLPITVIQLVYRCSDRMFRYTYTPVNSRCIDININRIRKKDSDALSRAQQDDIVVSPDSTLAKHGKHLVDNNWS